MTNNQRRQLPPQIKKLSITNRRTGKTVVRYQVTVDTGVSPATGRRRQARRRYATEKEARTALAEIADATAKGQFVARSAVTVEQVCADYVSGRHKLRKSSLAKLAYDLGPLRQQHGSVPIQRLTKAHLDRLCSGPGGGRDPHGEGTTPPALVRCRCQQSDRDDRSAPCRCQRSGARPKECRRKCQPSCAGAQDS
jgi:Arm DNA-binding domain